MVVNETTYENRNKTVMDLVKSNLCLQFDNTILHKDIKGKTCAPNRKTKNNINDIIFIYILTPIKISKIKIDQL